MGNKATKKGMVMEHLNRYGSITSMEAIENYGATRLSAIIFNLRNEGMNIRTENMPFTDRYGSHSVFAKYILVK